MSSQIEVITPNIFDEKEVSAWFTLKNPEYHPEGTIINGLNLGLNTPENEEQIDLNRIYLAKHLGLKPSNLAYAKQVHKTQVAEVRKGGLYENTDAMVSRTPGIALCIQVADCAAVLFADDQNKVIGAAHAGWRGAIGNIVPKTINRMKELGAEIKNLRVFISPCLSEKAFESGEEVAGQFPDKFVNRVDFKKPHIDLKGFIRYQLLKEGVPAEQIQTHSGCTLSEKKYYSYRRENDHSGRMMGIITLDW